MKYQTKNNHFFDNTKDIYLTEGSKRLCIMYGGNLDLYWSILDKSLEDLSTLPQIDFTITKENYGVYEEFERLFERVKNIDIFEEPSENEEFSFLNTFTNPDEEKKLYKEYNVSHYNDLFHDDMITWYSDETNPKVANYVTIKKVNESFVVSFFVQPHIKGYEEDSHHFNSITVRFRNSGSRYDPFNILFMDMYKRMQEKDDVLDEGHQIHLEEYLYEKNMVRNRNNKRE